MINRNRLTALITAVCVAAAPFASSVSAMASETTASASAEADSSASGETETSSFTEGASSSAEGTASLSEETADGDEYILDAIDPEDVDIEEAASAIVYETFEINSMEDFMTFTENCHVDTWSENKYVLLNVDLDFEEEEFEPIELFCGLFDGQNHTLSGILITGYMDETGVFGTIAEGAIVANLNVEGNIAPTGYQDILGGIVGNNYGTVSNCTFNGDIHADSEVGGIAAYNAESGILIGCSTSGSILANSGCGGIVGYNEGTVSGCENGMEINTAYQDTTTSLDELSEALDTILQNGSLLNSGELTEDSDIGGVAGFSSGVVLSCTNRGTVGYEHVGYNVGGIVGRSSGYVSGCTNYAQVYGRKDVGGIVGQMQPYLNVEFDEETLDDLETELDILGDMVQDLLDDVEGESGTLSNHLTNIGGLVDIAMDSVSEIADDAADTVDDMSDQINDAGDKLSTALTIFASVGDDLGDYLDNVTDAFGNAGSSISSYLNGIASSVESLVNAIESALPTDSGMSGENAGPEADWNGGRDGGGNPDAGSGQEGGAGSGSGGNGNADNGGNTGGASGTDTGVDTGSAEGSSGGSGSGSSSNGGSSSDAGGTSADTSADTSASDTSAEDSSSSDDSSGKKGIFSFLFSAMADVSSRVITAAAQEDAMSDAAAELSGSGTYDSESGTAAFAASAASGPSDVVSAVQVASLKVTGTMLASAEGVTPENGSGWSGSGNGTDSGSSDSGSSQGSGSGDSAPGGWSQGSGSDGTGSYGDMTGSAGGSSGGSDTDSSSDADAGDSAGSGSGTTDSSSGGVDTSELEAEIQRLQEELAQNSTDTSGLEEEIAQLEEELAAATAISEYLAQYEEQIEALRQLIEELYESADFSDLMELLDSLDLSSLLSAIEDGIADVESTIAAIENILDSFSFSVFDTSGLTSSISDAMDVLKDSPDVMSDISTALNILASIDLQLDGISENTRTSADVLYSSLSQLVDEMEYLNQDVSGSVSVAKTDLSAISNQFDRVLDVLIDTVVDITEDIGEDGEELVEDVSDEDDAVYYRGYTTDCVNYGDVNADIDVGGIVGMIDVEYSLDPELDVETSGNATLDYIFQAKCTVDECTNRGNITTRSNYAGGIAGRMEMGVVKYSSNYGTLDCSGNYIGGIVGYSAGTVRNNTAKCDISGGRYVGGITGYGTKILYNLAMVNILDYEQYIGAISGSAQEVDEEDIYANYYYSVSLYGIDNVSYTGLAEGVSYAVLLTQDGLPEEFNDLVLTFVADDEVVGIITCAYGASIEESEIPQIPEQEGFYGVWSRTDYSCIVSDETITAEYLRYVTLLAAEPTREGGLSAIEVDGQFRQGDALTVVQETSKELELERWTLTIPDDGAETHQVRYLLPDGESSAVVHVYIISDGKKKEIETSTFSNYITFEVEGNEVTFSVDNTLSSAGQRKVFLIVGAVVLVAAVLLLLLIVRRRRRRAAARAEWEADDETSEAEDYAEDEDPAPEDH